MTKTTVTSHLLQSLKILTKLSCNLLSVKLTRLTGNGITLSVEEPRGDFEFQRILKDSYDLVKSLLGERTSSLCGVDLCLFQDKRGEATSYTSDSGDSDTDALSSFDIGVHDTKNVCVWRVT